MAHHIVYADKDTFISRGADVEGSGSRKNFGMDEIIEVGKTFQFDSTNVGTINRGLIRFDLSAVSKSVADGDINSSVKYYLKMYDAGAQELNTNNSLYAYAISQSWDEGDGYKTDSPQTENGVSWKLRTDHSSSLWAVSTSEWGATHFTGSGYAASQSFNKNQAVDMRMDITGVVNTWLASTIPNQGLVIKRDSLEETSISASGMFKFFSSKTHTIFSPYLEVVWDDSTWTTGSLTALTSDNLDKLNLYTENLKIDYKRGSLSKVRVKGREKYPTQTYATTSAYLDVKYLPSGSSMYSVIDTKTNTTIIPFGTGSKLSCDSTSNFFKLRTSGLEPERFYKILYMIESGSGVNKVVNYYDPDHQFKVSR